MPRIYGNLQPRKRSWNPAGFFKTLRLFFWTILVIGGLYLLLASPIFKIHTIEIQGATLTEPSALEAQISKGGSIWTFSKGRLVAKLLQDNPTLERVDVLRGLPDALRVQVKERSAAALWMSGTEAYVLDPDGNAFLQYKSDALPSTDLVVGKTILELPKIVDQSGLPVQLGDQAASSLFLQFTTNISEQLAALLPLYVLDHFEVGITTYDVTLVARSGIHIQLNSLGDAGVQMRNLARLVRDDKVSSATTVDLRIDRWAYVQ